MSLPNCDYRYRARVYSRPFMPGRRTWIYEVRNREGVLVATDNTADWAKMIDDARLSVAMFERMTTIGYRVKPWSHWLANAAANL